MEVLFQIIVLIATWKSQKSYYRGFEDTRYLNLRKENSIGYILLGDNIVIKSLKNLTYLAPLTPIYI